MLAGKPSMPSSKPSLPPEAPDDMQEETDETSGLQEIRASLQDALDKIDSLIGGGETEEMPEELPEGFAE